MSVLSDVVSGRIDTGSAITISCLHKEKATPISVSKHWIFSHLIPDYGCETTNLCIYFSTQILFFSVKHCIHMIISEQKCLYVIL